MNARAAARRRSPEEDAEPDEEHPKALYYTNQALAELLRAQALETTKIMALATKMRLAQQSTYDKSKRMQMVSTGH